jgi:AcrR family transcriptional regulator
MRRHGWGGNIPSNDAEAAARILRAAQHLLAEHPDTAPTISEVSGRLSVSRQTVYRYFPSTHDMLVASVSGGIAEFLDAIARHLEGETSPSEAVIEGIAYTYEQIQCRPDLSLLLATGSQSVHEVTSESSMQLGRSILGRLPIDWEAHGYNDGELLGLVELILRTLQSFVLDPGHPPRSPLQLREYLRHWVGPAVWTASGRPQLHR